MNTTSQKTVFLSNKGLKDVRKAINRLEHERGVVLEAVREIDKTHAHEERLARIEKLAQLDSIEAELESKRELLATARLLPTRRARLKVAIGSVVDLIDQQGRLFRYTLVDSLEANPSDGRISIASPLGSNLIGKTVQDIVRWSNGARSGQMQLVRIM